MCSGCVIDHIDICPLCKRDDEAYKLGEADPPFKDLGNGRLHCICGNVFDGEKEDESASAAKPVLSPQATSDRD